MAKSVKRNVSRFPIEVKYVAKQKQAKNGGLLTALLGGAVAT